MVLWWARMLLCCALMPQGSQEWLRALQDVWLYFVCGSHLPGVYRNTVQEYERKHQAYVMRDALLLIGNCATFALRVVISFYIGAVLWEQILYRV